MRGVEYKLIYTAISAIVVAATFAVGAFFLMGGLVETDVVQKTTFEKLRASDVAHLAKSCLMKDGYISMDYLKELKSNDKLLAEECRMSIHFGLSMEDRDTGEQFIYDYYSYSSASSQPLFVRLKVGDEIHLGEMIVSV